MSSTPAEQTPAGAEMTGSEWIAEFLARAGCDRVFLLTGGARIHDRRGRA